MIQYIFHQEKRQGLWNLMVQKKIFQHEYSIPLLSLWECIYFSVVRDTYIQCTPLQQSHVEDLQVQDQIKIYGTSVLLSNFMPENKGTSQEELGICGRFCPGFSFGS